MAKKKVNKPSHVSKGSVFDDLGFDPKALIVIKVKAELHAKIMQILKKRNITPRQLERILDKPQPRISELLNGKISKLSIEKLLECLEGLGASIKIDVKFDKAA